MVRNKRRGSGDEPAPPAWADLDTAARRRLVATSIVRMVVAGAGLLIAYGAVPINGRSNFAAIVVMIAGTAAFVLAVSFQFRRLLHSPYPTLRAAQTLVVVVLVFLVGFALTYASLSAVDPENFSEPLNRLDAFYFTVTVAATVGFGDITPITSLARLIVTIQMVIGLTLIGVLFRVVAGIAERRRSEVTPQQP
jgi:hypothetical protein